MIHIYLAENNLLSNFQSGFRPLHSTPTSLANVTNNILQNIDRGQLTGLVFLDHSKGFDTLDHNILLDKLTVSFNFNKSATQWFSSYLTGRSQNRVCVDRAVSQLEKLLYMGYPRRVCWVHLK